MNQFLFPYHINNNENRIDKKFSFYSGIAISNQINDYPSEFTKSLTWRKLFSTRCGMQVLPRMPDA